MFDFVSSVEFVAQATAHKEKLRIQTSAESCDTTSCRLFFLHRPWQVSMKSFHRCSFKITRQMQSSVAKMHSLACVVHSPEYCRDKSGREWLDRLQLTSGLKFTSAEKIDAAAISSAPSKYQMIMCFDPLMSTLLMTPFVSGWGSSVKIKWKI